MSAGSESDLFLDFLRSVHHDLLCYFSKPHHVLCIHTGEGGGGGGGGGGIVIQHIQIREI